MPVGRVRGAFGLRGALRVRYTGDDIRNLARARELRAGADPDAARPVRVRACRPGRRGEAILELEGVEDRDAAEAFRGLLLFSRVECLEPLGEGEYYHFQLVGCRVVDLEGRELGRVRAIFETPGGDLLAVTDAAGREHLLPTAGEFLREVRLSAREIRYAPIPGLLGAAPGGGTRRPRRRRFRRSAGEGGSRPPEDGPWAREPRRGFGST